MSESMNEKLKNILTGKDDGYKKDMIRAYCKGVKDANREIGLACENCRLYADECLVKKEGVKELDFLYELAFSKDKREEDVEVIKEYECPTCAATLKEEEVTCPECGEEFEDDPEIIKNIKYMDTKEIMSTAKDANEREDVYEIGPEEDEPYDLSGSEEDDEEIDNDYECPTCGAGLKAESYKCPECGEEFAEDADEEGADELAGLEGLVSMDEEYRKDLLGEIKRV